MEETFFVGTEVLLKAKIGYEHYFKSETIEKLILHYGIMLPFPITLDHGNEKKRINPVYLPWDGRNTNKEELMMFGQVIF